MLGGAVARALAARGDEVTVLQRGVSGLPVREVRADLGDPAAPLAAALAGQDAVMHLAAKVDVVGPWREYARTNVDGTRRLLAAARDVGVARFVHVRRRRWRTPATRSSVRAQARPIRPAPAATTPAARRWPSGRCWTRMPNSRAQTPNSRT